MRLQDKKIRLKRNLGYLNTHERVYRENKSKSYERTSMYKKKGCANERGVITKVTTLTLVL